MDELMFMHEDCEIASDYGYCPSGIIEYRSHPVNDEFSLQDKNDIQKSTPITSGEVNKNWSNGF